MPGLPSSGALRTEALSAPVSRSDVRQHGRSGGDGSRAVELLRFVLIPSVGVLACTIGAAALVFGITEELASSAPDRVSESVVMAAIAGGMLFGGVLLGLFLVRGRAQRLPPASRLRLARFAEQNGMVHEPGPDRPHLLAGLQQRGDVLVRAVVRAPGPPEVEVGNVELRVGEDRGRQTRLGGYCAVRMPRPGPDLLLRSEEASGHPLTADAPPARGQRLLLTGGATVSCPVGYEDDARFLLTTEVVGGLSDPGGAWDLEVVGDVLVLSRPEAAATLDPEQWRRIAALVAVLERRLDQWSRWRTDRLGAPVLPEPLAAASPYLPDPTTLPDPVPAARLRTTAGRRWLTPLATGGGIVAFVLLARLLDH